MFSDYNELKLEIKDKKSWKLQKHVEIK
jgi:hypothetical protein